ncbi:MAG: DUF402 domain-containing protein [Acidimicrobiia bacterium]
MRPITVQYFKYPKALHWRHEMVRLGDDHHGVWLGASAGAVVQRGDEPPIHWPTPFVQLIAPEAWWTLLYNGEDSTFPCYVDVITPARWVDKARVEMVDLDLDVVRRADGTVEVLDEDEFLEHCLLLDYPDWMAEAARKATARLVGELGEPREPFGRSPERWLARLTD